MEGTEEEPPAFISERDHPSNRYIRRTKFGRSFPLLQMPRRAVILMTLISVLYFPIFFFYLFPKSNKKQTKIQKFPRGEKVTASVVAHKTKTECDFSFSGYLNIPPQPRLSFSRGRLLPLSPLEGRVCVCICAIVFQFFFFCSRRI